MRTFVRRMANSIDKYGVSFRDDGKTLFRCPQNFRGDYIIPEGTISIASNAFGSCTELTSVVIPASVEYIGDGAFNRCSELKSVVILTEHLNEIASSCFRYCSQLREIHIPLGIKKIGSYAFSFSGLSSIVLPETVSDIEYGAFYLCENLSFVQFPNHPLNISQFAFHGCAKLDGNISQITGKEHIMNGCRLPQSRGKKRTKGTITDADMTYF